MSKFALRRIEAISGDQTFEELCIDGVGVFESFENEICGTTYKAEFERISSFMKLVADLKYPPKNIYKTLSGYNHNIKEYEFRTKHLRVYCVAKSRGKVVVLFGKKTNQDQDLRKFRSLKESLIKENLI